MDDLGRAWAILGLAPGSSPDAVKAAYRDLVKQWHPDKFQGDTDRLDEGHEMLKEINWAYNYLLEHPVFLPEAPAPPNPDPPLQEEDPLPTSGPRRWATALLVI